MDHFPQDFFLGEEDVDAGSVASVNALKDMLSSSLLQTDDKNENNVNKEKPLVWIVDPIGEFAKRQCCK